MKSQQYDDLGLNGAPDTAPSEDRVGWVAPLESIKQYSVAEFTRNFSFPGDDGLGIFTQS